MRFRNIALTAFIASLLSLFTPIRNMVLTLAAIITGSDASDAWRFIPFALVLCLIGVVMPVFLFALYRDRGIWQIPRGMRWLSLAAAVILGLFVMSTVWTEFPDPDFKARGGAMDAASRAASHISSLLNALMYAVFMALLFSFFMQSRQGTEAEVSRSPLLDKATRIAVLVYGMEIAFVLFRIVLIACTSHRNSPSLHVDLLGTTRMLLTQACLFAIPYVILRSRRLEVGY